MRGFTNILIGIIVAAVVIGIGSYFVISKKIQVSKEEPIVSSPQNETIATEQAEPTPPTVDVSADIQVEISEEPPAPSPEPIPELSLPPITSPEPEPEPEPPPPPPPPVAETIEWLNMRGEEWVSNIPPPACKISQNQMLKLNT